VPTEYRQGIPGEVVLETEYHTEVAMGDDTVLISDNDSPEVSGIVENRMTSTPDVSTIVESRMTSTPNRVGIVSGSIRAPARRPHRLVAAVPRILEYPSSPVRPNSPAAGEVSDNEYVV